MGEMSRGRVRVQYRKWHGQGELAKFYIAWTDGKDVHDALQNAINGETFRLWGTEESSTTHTDNYYEN